MQPYDDDLGVRAIMELEQLAIQRGYRHQTRGDVPLTEAEAQQAWAAMPPEVRLQGTISHIMCFGGFFRQGERPMTVIAKSLAETAGEVLQQGGEIPFTICLADTEGTGIIHDMNLRSGEDRHAVDKFILDQLTEHPELVEVAIISEAWRSHKDVKPEYDLDRQDALILYSETKEGGTVLYLADITGKEGGPRQLGPLETERDTKRCRFRNFFARAEAQQYMAEHIDQLKQQLQELRAELEQGEKNE